MGRKSHIHTNYENEQDILDTVRTRTLRLIRATINSVFKITEDSSMGTIQVYKDELLSRWTDYIRAYENHEAALNASANQQIDEITREYIDMHNNYVKAKVHIQDLLHKSHGPSSIHNDPPPTHDSNAQSNFKLPPIKITPFSGDVSQWIEFKATCNSVLTPNIPDIHRLQYLKEALVNTPRNLVGHIVPGNNRSYEDAMNLLTEQYENIRTIINLELQKFDRVEYVAKPSANAFRSLLNAIRGLTAALSSCDIDYSTWNSVLIYYTVKKFDKNTVEFWEEQLKGLRTIPPLKTLLNFIEVRITVLETTEMHPQMNSGPERGHKPFFKQNVASGAHYANQGDKIKAFFTLKSEYKCALCGKNHLPSRCDELSRIDSRNLLPLVKANNLCENCLYPHGVAACPFNPACKKCNQAHHTLLHSAATQMFLTMNPTEISHDAVQNENDTISNAANDDVMSTHSSQHFYHTNDNNDDETLLATAMVPVKYNGRSILLKALIDQGSTANLITSRACTLLKLQVARANIPMLGVGDSPVGFVVGRTTFELGSIHESSYKLHLRSVVVKHIGNVKGVEKGCLRKWTHLTNLSLADPNYFEAHKIDLLLGGSAHADFILSGVIKGERHQPIAQLTRLGWIISGHIQASSNFVAIRNTKIESLDDAENDLNQRLKAFWELEEVNCQRIFTKEEQIAETTFTQSVKRAADGKFIVDLPFKLDPYKNLGDSAFSATKRYKSLQRRFERDPSLKLQYDTGLEEYLSLKHMELVTDKPKFQHFLPHHPVIKESSSTTKVRGVYDASAKTSTGVSLNDCLCVGPVIQSELFDLLINWRKFQFAITGDVEKMYRQMYVNHEHANLQTILWQRPGDSDIRQYRLLTVTFGTSSAPYQATRGVYEIGERVKPENQELAEAIQTCFYVDDFMKSFSTIESAMHFRESITKTLAAYGFNLRKWKTNESRILESVENCDKEECLDINATFKALGITWQPKTDAFVFKPSEVKQVEHWSKRQVLSEIAKLFDPLGWLAPCIARAKILMQDIWRLPKGIDWDSKLPDHIVDQWAPIFNELTSQIPIQVPRWLKFSNNNEKIEIHAFCDASMLSYACCVYMRIIHSNGTVSCNLIAAKTKVSPVKAITIPRLELCAAVLLSRLVTRCIRALSLTEYRLFAWSDSKVVLAWLSAHASKWNVFVSNRVSEIQQAFDVSNWLHIPSKQNPADLASRGCSISELGNANSWWHGPAFLTSSSIPSPKQDHNWSIESAPEKKKNVKVFTVTMPKENRVLEYISNYTRLLRFTCHALRWLGKSKKQPSTNKPIDASEIENAENRWIKIVQREHFGHEIGRLKANRTLPKSSNLLTLTPFVDKEDLLRMNGRVKNSELEQQKKSIILPSYSRLTTLLIQEVHERSALHGGVQLTLQALRQRFWIVHARNQVKKIVGKCVLCYRRKKRLLTQQMAELPSFRTEQAKPFSFVGCDYAGYFDIKSNERKNAPTTKAYIALFMCLTTKALHLEVVCDLSTAEFIMAFENFIARRGIPNLLYTDNAKNFIGAEKEINKLHNQMLAQDNEVTKMLANKRITVRHTPARASHMAGIWERSVGLVKYHLKRVMTDTKLTARRFDHVLKQIECCLNSRPLWSITANADDIEVITPSHFFNFQAINTLPRPDLGHIKIDRLNQYQYLYRLYTEFWKGWSKEYLTQLQPRTKWNKRETNVRIGQIVVISDDNVPPSRWPVGKIVNVFPAKDGLIRTVEVLCRGNVLKRPIHRLGLLPILDNDQLRDSNESLNGGEDVGAF